MSELDQLLLKEWFSPKGLRDRVIYHYTSAAGLIGILESGTLRGTSAAFLNDTSEIAYGLAVCREVLEQECSGPGDVDRMLRAQVDDALGDDAPSEIFITSFSAIRDGLGQWRGYGSAAGRYSIGVRPAQFSERDILRFPQAVDYDPESQHARIRHAIEVTRRHLQHSADDRGRAFQDIVSLAFYLRRLACTFKHPGFQPEQEWRSVISLDDSGSVSGLRFEATDGIPRPYILMLEGSRESRRLPVTEVRVRTINRHEAAVFATRLLLQRLGYENVEVTRSDIPLAP